MTFIDILADEISSDPLGRGYTAMTDEQVLADINSKYRDDIVPNTDVIKYLTLVGKWSTIVDYSRNGTVELNRRVALNIVEIVKAFTTFDLLDATVLAAVTAQLDAMVASTFIAANDKTAILALGANRKTRAAELGINVKLGNIQEVRG